MSATTPEGKVKKEINKILDSYGDTLYRYMPVPGGYGKPGLDYHCVFMGVGFFVEAKAPGEEPNARQEGTIEDVMKAGAWVWVIDGTGVGYQELALWLRHIVEGARPSGVAPFVFRHYRKWTDKNDVRLIRLLP